MAIDDRGTTMGIDSARAVHLSPPWRRQRQRGSAILLIAAMLVLIAGCVEPPPPPGPRLAMDAAMSTGFFSFPWPNDVRRNPDGTLDLSGLPGVGLLPGETTTPLRDRFPGVIASIGDSLHGFGTNTASYFSSELALDPASFPTPARSDDATSPILLMDLDHPGERVPVLVDLQRQGDRNRPDNLLTILPYPGHPLSPSTRYAVAVLDGVRGANGGRVRPAPLLQQLTQPWTPATGVSEADWGSLVAQRDDVLDVLEATTTGSAEHLVAFTVFTTQDVQADLQGLAATIAAAPAPQVVVTSQSACAPDPEAPGTESSRIVGTVELTRWQAGTHPYIESGGEIVLDTNGHAIPQGRTPEEFSARVPCGPAPDAGWPLLTFVDGSGGTWAIDDSQRPFEHTGFVLAQIAPTYGVGRDVVATPLLQSLGITSPSEVSRFLFYNFLNPDAARSNVIQQAGEHLELIAAMTTFVVDGDSVGTTGTVGIDPSRRVVAGHSQGAQSLPLIAAARPELAGVVSSVGSGGLYHTISHNLGNRQFLGAMNGDAEVLDELNPIVQVAQTMLEGGDGLNYPNTMDYLSWAGTEDACSPFENTRYFAGATGLPLFHQVSPTSLYGAAALDPPTVALPVQGNVAGRTRVSLELAGGHYVAYDHRSVTDGFLAGLAAGTTPVVASDGFAPGWLSSQPCGASRWDVPPTRYGR